MARECTITREEFAKSAHAQKVGIRPYGSSELSVEVMAPPKQFSTNSLGWYANGKGQIEVGGKLVDVQIGVTITVIGSKELPLESGSKAA